MVKRKQVGLGGGSKLTFFETVGVVASPFVGAMVGGAVGGPLGFAVGPAAGFAASAKLLDLRRRKRKSKKKVK